VSWQGESEEERAEREQMEAELQERRERERVEREEMRAKINSIAEIKSALDSYLRVMRWKTDHYMRPVDFTESKYEEEIEIAAWQVQGTAEALRERMPELFWPKGTPVRVGGGIYVRPDKLNALRLDLEVTAEAIAELLADPIDPEEDEEDGE
jgi:hypothetical protein